MFKDCWDLNNLRPLSAKQNNLDGDRKQPAYTKNTELVVIGDVTVIIDNKGEQNGR